MTKTTRRYRSRRYGRFMRRWRSLHTVGAIDKATMRDFDLGCLTPVEPLAPEASRRIREQSHMSQATFARALNVSTVLISKRNAGKCARADLRSSSSPDKKGIDAIL